MTGINGGSIIDIFHRLFRLFKPAMESLVGEYRRASVRHADSRTPGRPLSRRVYSDTRNFSASWWWIGITATINSLS
jgi:hypothetical protein